MDPAAEELHKRREEFFEMCERGIEVMNASATHLLRFNFKCIALGRPADPEELEALADLIIETKQCCGLVRLRNDELFAESGVIAPFDLMLERLGQISEFVEVLIERSGL